MLKNEMTKADKIRQAREKLGLSQVKMAKLMGVSIRCVHRWEVGKHSPSDGMVMLAEMLAEKDTKCEKTA